MSEFKLYFWPIETVARDLGYKLELADQINDENSLHVFARPWTLSYAALFLQGVNWVGQNLFHKYCFSNHDTADLVRKRGGQIFYFDEEGGFYFPKKLAEDVFRHRYLKKKFGEKDCIFVWGKAQMKILDSMGLNSILVGHPRFQQRVRKSKANKNAILILTNFSLIFSQKSFLNEFDKEYFPTRRTESITDAGRLFDFVSNIESGKQIFIRPHPSEDLNLYDQMFRHIPNVTILPRQSLAESFAISNKVYHFNCTSALDAYCLGLETQNLGNSSSTIIDEIPKNQQSEFFSKWLVFPSKSKTITKIIKERSVYSKANRKWFVYFLIALFETIYLLRTTFIGNYEKNKFGNMPASSKNRAFNKQFIIRNG